MKDKAQRIALLKAYLETRRGGGHTFAMVNGIVSCENVTVLVANLSHKTHIESMARKKIRAVTLDDLDSLRGLTDAIVFDNAAMVQILEDALGMLRELRSENSILRAENQSLKKSKHTKAEKVPREKIKVFKDFTN